MSKTERDKLLAWMAQNPLSYPFLSHVDLWPLILASEKLERAKEFIRRRLRGGCKCVWPRDKVDRVLGTTVMDEAAREGLKGWLVTHPLCSPYLSRRHVTELLTAADTMDRVKAMLKRKLENECACVRHRDTIAALAGVAA